MDPGSRRINWKSSLLEAPTSRTWLRGHAPLRTLPPGGKRNVSTTSSIHWQLKRKQKCRRRHPDVLFDGTKISSMFDIRWWLFYSSRYANAEVLVGYLTNKLLLSRNVKIGTWEWLPFYNRWRRTSLSKSIYRGFITSYRTKSSLRINTLQWPSPHHCRSSGYLTNVREPTTSIMLTVYDFRRVQLREEIWFLSQAEASSEASTMDAVILTE